MSSSLSGDDMPNRATELKLQIEALEKLNCRIKLLEDELDIARNQQIHVQDKILQLQACRGYILRLPREVLTFVFDYHSEDQRECNASLMFVCKSWYQLLINTPWLWTNIILKLETIEGASSVWKYAHTCIGRSRNTIINIFIDATEFGSPEHTFTDIIKGSGIESNEWDYYPYNEENRFGHLIQKEKLERPTIYEYGLFIALGILSGDEGQHMSRWKSLRIYLHYNLSYWAPYHILDSLTGKETTNLVEFDIRGIGGDYAGINLSQFAGIPAVKSVVTGVNLSNERVPTPLPHIEHLSILDLGGIFYLSAFGFPSFQSLLSLELEGGMVTTKDSMPVFIPRLKYLAVETAYLLPYFDVPQLTHLSITYGSYGFPPNGIPTVTNFRYCCPYGDDEDISEDLMSIVRSMPLLRRVHIPARKFQRYSDVCTTLGEMVGRRETTAYCVENTTSWPVTLQNP